MDSVYDLNKKYEENASNGVYNGISNLKIIKGNIPIILSAPHSVVHVRNGIFKRSDGLTGGIVEYLSDVKNTYGITRVHNMLDDPNYYNYGISLIYKQEIVKLIKEYNIKYLLDIHGCSDNNPFSIDIGTNNLKNINSIEELEILKKYLQCFEGLTVDNKFKASLSSNISRYIHELTNISCFQLEINCNIRFNKTKELLNSLGYVIDELGKKKKK